MAEHSTAPVSEVRVEVQEPTSWSRRLSITVPSERVRRVRQSVAAKIAGNVRLPGFRKGKTPASLVERQFGPAIEQETVDRVIQETYREALDSHEFRPITQGQVEHVHYHGDGGDLHFEVEFEVQPVVDLARTEGFQVVRPADADRRRRGGLAAGAAARRARAACTRWKRAQSPTTATWCWCRSPTWTRPARATRPRAASTASSWARGRPFADIEAAIMSLAPGEEGEFTVTFPEDFADEAQRGQQQRLRIRVEEARRKELPALDDEFAKGLGDFDSLEALRTRVRDDLQNDAKKRADSAMRDALVQQIVEANPFDVPASMVDRYLAYMMGENPDDEGSRRKRSPEDEERFSQLRAIMRPQAEASLKRMMVVEHIAEREGLRPTADDVDARVEAMAEQHGRTPSDLWVELERSGQMQALEAEILEDKVFEHLQSRNTVAQA